MQNNYYLKELTGSIIISALVAIFFYGIGQMIGPVSLANPKIYLDYSHFPEYLLRTMLRFFIAMLCSVMIAIFYATLCAKNKRIAFLLIPILNVFQSIPVLGYLSFAVTAFLNLFPNNIFGIECAIIFAIITAQIWNIIYSVYQSLINVPQELYEVAKIYNLNKWKIFWIIELPFAIPGLIWNIVLSITASCFFVVAQEVIQVGVNSYQLPGLGAYIALALKQSNLIAIFHSLIMIILIIVFFDQVFFKPLIVWSEKFKYEFNVSGTQKAKSLMLDLISETKVSEFLYKLFENFSKLWLSLELPKIVTRNLFIIFFIFEMLFWLLLAYSFYYLYKQLHEIISSKVNLQDLIYCIKLSSLTALRVLAILIFSSLIWVPIGIYVGLRDNIASKVQPLILFFTSIPANLYYPIFALSIVNFNLNPDIWLSVMMVIGAQWYIFFNVVGGAQSIPNELREVWKLFKLKRFSTMTKIILPSIAPNYITGLITASGASWNASIVSEIIIWGDKTISAKGIGSYIALNTQAGNYANIALGIIVMSVFIIISDHFIWNPLSNHVSNKYRL